MKKCRIYDGCVEVMLEDSYFVIIDLSLMIFFTVIVASRDT